MSDVEEQKPGISRRTVAKAMAWAVPAVAIAAPAPAFAASCVPDFSFSGDSCKCPGEGNNDKQYHLGICVTNVCDDVTVPGFNVYVWDIENQSNKHLVPASGDFPVIIPIQGNSGCSELQEFVWPEGTTGNSANGLYVWYTIDDVNEANAVKSERIDSPPNCDPEAGLCGEEPA